MPKYRVIVIRKVRDGAVIEVEAANKTAVKKAAIEAALYDSATINWVCQETHSVDVINVEPIEETDTSEGGH
jgi:hypothetical protein